MVKKKTLEEYIKRAKVVHRNDYDYSLIKDYINCTTKVPIKCNRCKKIFQQSLYSHVTMGQGCPFCNIVHHKPVCGVGINDYREGRLRFSNQVEPSYRVWKNMLLRCYDENVMLCHVTYKDCYVCDEWLVFSTFKKWFDENYVEGYSIDKDILFKGNKVYSPETCCFVPRDINVLFTKRQNRRGKYPIGVTKVRKRYVSYVNVYGKSVTLGTFDTVEEAFCAYKTAKESHIQEVAQRYYNEKKITERVYNALMNYKVEITD